VDPDRDLHHVGQPLHVPRRPDGARPGVAEFDKLVAVPTPDGTAITSADTQTAREKAIMPETNLARACPPRTKATMRATSILLAMSSSGAPNTKTAFSPRYSKVTMPAPLHGGLVYRTGVLGHFSESGVAILATAWATARTRALILVSKEVPSDPPQNPPLVRGGAWRSLTLGDGKCPPRHKCSTENFGF
jgi:hypothetical protein